MLVRFYRSSVVFLLCSFIVLFPALANATLRPLPADWKTHVMKVFPAADHVTDENKKTRIATIYAGKKILGYSFQTAQQVDIPAYSGQPVNTVVTIDTKGIIKNTWVVEQHEPILLVGIPVQKLYDFAAQFVGKSVADHIEVGTGKDTIDGISSATVTSMVVDQSIMHASKKVAEMVGILKKSAIEMRPHAIVKRNLFKLEDWKTLIGDGSIRHMHLIRAQVDKAFVGTAADDVDVASPDQKNDTFINFYYTYLNAPTIGENLLGKKQFQWLIKKLKPGEHAIAIMANGIYSFKGSGYVRGGIFDRIKLSQGLIGINFRDLDYYRLSDIYAKGYPDFNEMGIFIIRKHFNFDPGAPWNLQLLVKRATGPLSSIFHTFKTNYQIPEKYITRPVVKKPLPIWARIWLNHLFQEIIIGLSLLILLGIIFMQDILVSRPRLLHNLRRGYLIYTLFYLGWYSLGQLSVENVFTFAHALMGKFHWSIFLMDPVIFMLWAFTAATILLWGRGVFCGWLCPFGALQELINELARKLKVKQYELPFAVHERLWALKYIILLVLFGISLQSVSLAEKAAEIEPFKTSIMLGFHREWWFVLYALTLLFVSIFTRKVYCRYICPLGAALAIPTKLRLFDWLKRRKECGNPCQLCAVECEIQAIQPDGKINANECHHCLDCQMTYHDEKKCPPLVNKNKKRNKRRDDPSKIAVTRLDSVKT